MGALLSIACSAAFCLERVLTWTCCAFLLITVLTIMILLMIYGIAIGYHYAQKELASFALYSRTTTMRVMLRSDEEESPVVRLLAVNRSEAQQQQEPFEYYETKKPDARVFLETSETPVVVLETEKSVTRQELTQNEKELARRLIGRFRRSRNNASTTTTTTRLPFLRPLRGTPSVLLST